MEDLWEVYGGQKKILKELVEEKRAEMASEYTMEQFIQLLQKTDKVRTERS
jgi:hypothetical protein